eukprot:TRINITY_DN29471_c0_g1_i3.p1 TRINITY_DN29471_c0_g1~~TRINITY_DN29471_c0_g1_i3.p1  ORF type:complete len:649 (-),score=40.58 TRINITY_DN29471_c0_g1_i3:324-2270(-)
MMSMGKGFEVVLLFFLFLGPSSELENDAYTGLTWFLQISDVHISFKHPDRTKEFREFVRDYLGVYKPDLVLCTGDLTDGKIFRGMSSKQVESEWRDYHDVVVTDRRRRQDTTPWLDIRGNHDNLNVLNRQSQQNYFRNYSSMGLQGNLESYKYSTRLRGRGYNFIALDATLDVGTRFPFNFVGDISTSQQDKIRSLVKDVNPKDHTIFFGHYPSSTVRAKEFLLSTVSSGLVYLNGHLHDLAIFRLHTMYSFHGGQNLELELVDWKWNRAYRLLAIDQGFLSFTDLRFGSDNWPVILPTLPKRSDFLLQSKEPDFDLQKFDQIRTLVFSASQILSVSAFVDDGDEITCRKEGDGPLYTCPWNPHNYKSGLHKLKIVAKDNSNRVKAVQQSFSLDKVSAKPFNHAFANFVLGASFSVTFQVLYLVSALLSISFLPVLYFIAKLSAQRYFSERVNGIVQRILHCCCLRKALNVTSVKPLFYFFTLFPLYLAVGPWVIGKLVEDTYGAAFAWGTFVSTEFVATEVGYFKYAMQTLFIHPIVLLVCGHILECRAYYSGQNRGRKCGIMMHIVVGILFFLASYLFIFESIIFWLQFGVMGAFLGILSTWSLIFYSGAIFWSVRVSRSSVYTNVVIEDHGKKTDDEQEDDILTT